MTRAEICGARRVTGLPPADRRQTARHTYGIFRLPGVARPLAHALALWGTGGPAAHPGQEATVTTTTPTVTVQHEGASEPGALAGWHIRCTCGAHLTTSLSRRVADMTAERHLTWHAAGLR